MIDVRGRKFEPKKKINGNIYANIEVYEGLDGERYIIPKYDDQRKKLESVRAYVSELQTNLQVNIQELAKITGARRSDLQSVISTSASIRPSSYDSVIVQRLVDDLGIREDIESLTLWKYYYE